MATAAAAVVGRLRRELEQSFFDNDAFSPDRAIELELTAPVQQRYLDQLIAESIVREAPSGRYWLDLRRFEDDRRQRFAWSMRILALGAVVFVVIFAIRAILQLR